MFPNLGPFRKPGVWEVGKLGVASEQTSKHLQSPEASGWPLSPASRGAEGVFLTMTEQLEGCVMSAGFSRIAGMPQVSHSTPKACF